MAQYRSASGVATGDRVATLPLRRVPANEKVVGIVTTFCVREVWTHYFRGHTVGCSKPACPGCNAKCALKYEAYLGLYNPAKKTHFILVLTVGAVRQIADQIGRLDGLRGLSISMCRPQKIATGRVVVQCGLIDPSVAQLPAPFEPLDHLARIWGVEHVATVENLQEEAEKIAFLESTSYTEAQNKVVGERWSTVEQWPTDSLEDQTSFLGS